MDRGEENEDGDVIGETGLFEQKLRGGVQRSPRILDLEVEWKGGNVSATQKPQALSNRARIGNQGY